MIDYSMLLRRVSILKCKRFKDLSYIFVICSIIGFWSIFGDFITFFIEVKCDYLVFPNNLKWQFYKIHQITLITSIKHWYDLKF